MQAPFEDAQHAKGPTQEQLKALNAEYETDIHFQKCYGVMSELFEAHGYLSGILPDTGFKFLDLGCAPGGFSSYMLEDPRCRAGFGVTLPSTSGGFPMRLRSNNFFLQQADLFEVGPTDLLASNVNVCICDAQYLRNNVAWDEKYSGVRCRSKQHGVWALLIKQFWLGLSKLLTGGILIFRFGWRDPGPEDLATIWYKKCTMRLFSILFDLFEQVREVKSDHFNALQSSFYVCCANFDRAKFEDREVAKLLGQQFNYLLTTRIQDANELEIMAMVDKIRTPEVDRIISDMLDRVDKLRLIHQQSRRWHRKEAEMHEDSRAVIFVAPVPAGMGAQELEDFFSVYGIVHRVDVNGTEEASIQYTKVEHAQTAVRALRSSPNFSSVFGAEARVWIRQEEVEQRPNDAWAQEWSATPSAASETSATWHTDASWASQAQHGWGNASDEWKGGGASQAPPGFSSGSKGSRKGAGKDHRGGYSGASGGDNGKGAQRPKPSGQGQPKQAAQPQQPRQRQQQRSGGETWKPKGSPPTTDSATPQPERGELPSQQGTREAGLEGANSGENESQSRPDLHPALQDHQAKTKELIAQLLKPK